MTRCRPRSRPFGGRLLVAFGVALAVVLAVLGASGVARADDVADEADHLFALGAEHYQAHDYKNALQYFLASNRLVRNRNVMFNIGRTYEHMNQPSDAYRYYQRALDGETDPATKQRIKDSMQRLAAIVALLRVETDPPNATIYLNRKDLGDRGTSPQTIALPPGTYTVIAELAGYDETSAKPVEVKIGTEKTVSLKLTRVIGMLRITSPPQASVRFDADDTPVVCETPCDAPASPGQHTLILTKPGYRVTRQNVVVRANTLVEVKPELEPETGSLVVNADERDAVIEIDGQTKGFTPSVLTVPTGPHLVRVTLRGFRPVERSIEMKANEQTQLDLQLVSADAIEAASRVAEPIEDAPASATLITSPELRAMRYPTVAEALRGVRGVYVTDDSTYKNVGFRGFGRPGDYGNRVLVLIDGHPINDDWIWSSYVGYDLRTDIEDVERIEVVRGPGSILYGTGAFSGVVNIVAHTRDTPDGREVGISTADNGVARARARITRHFTKDFGITTSLAAGHGTGRDIFMREYVADGPPSVAGYSRGLDSFNVATWSGRIFYKALSAQWSFNVHDKRIPGGGTDELFGDARSHQVDSRAFVEVKFEPRITDNVQSVSRVHVNYYAYRGFFARLPDQGNVERSTFDGMWAGAEQRFIFSPHRILRLTGGGEAQYHFLVNEALTSRQPGVGYDDNYPFTLVAGYLLADVAPTNTVKLNAGARLDAYSMTDPSVNPRAAAILKPWTGGNIKIMGGKAFRAPSVYESYYADSSVQKALAPLKPENLYSAEVEVSQRLSSTVVATAATYANYITDLIVLREANDPATNSVSSTYQNNRVPVGTLGAELEIRRDWKEGWMLAGSYSFQKSRYLASRSIGDLVTFDRAAGLREVPNSPSLLASIKGGVPIISRSLMLMSRLTLEGPRFDRNDIEAPGQPAQRTTAPGLLWDIVFSGSEPRWGLSYAVGLYNAFDSRWAVPLSSESRPTTLVQSGRTVLALASITF